MQKVKVSSYKINLLMSYLTLLGKGSESCYLVILGLSPTFCGLKLKKITTKSMARLESSSAKLSRAKLT